MKYLSRLFKILLFILLIIFRTSISELLADFDVSETIVLALLNFSTFILGANLAIMGLSFFYRKRKNLKGGETDNVILGLQNVFYLLTVGSFIFTVLAVFGIDFVTLFTSLSIVAAAIAIVTKEYLNEIISGIIITFSRQISINNYVKIGKQKGKIIDLNLTKVSLLDEDDDIIFIPNHKVFTSEIINYTKKQIKKVNIPFEIDIKFLNTNE